MDEPAFDRERIAAAMKEQRVNQTEMARVMQLPSQSAFSNIMKQKRRVTAEEAKRAYDFLGIKAEPTLQWVPVIGITNAGNWREAIHMPMGNLPVRRGSVSQEAFAVEVAGDSMDKLIPEGGHIVIDPRDKELRDGKVYLIQNSDGEATVKAYFRSPARFEPVSSNPEHKGWLVSDCEFIVLGRVTMKIEPL
jgi:SOS-response transcriptional repressor LexA